MIKVAVLSSGSCGNSTFVSDGKTRILIDAGLRRPDLDKRMAVIGEDPMQLDACLVTHEHSDHVIGLQGLLTRYQIPVYCTEGTYQGLEKILLDAAGVGFQMIPEEVMQIGSISVLPVPVPHDANQPVAFFFHANDKMLAFATDLAYIDEHLGAMLRLADGIFLEANHDLDGLASSDYPERHKRRVRESHLCNDQVCDFLKSKGTWNGHIILGHLSEKNNNPALLHAMAKQALRKNCTGNPKLTVLPYGAQSPIVTL